MITLIIEDALRRVTAAPRFGTLRFEAGILFPSPRNYMNFGSEIDAWGLKMEVRESTLGPQGDVQKKRETWGPEGSLLGAFFMILDAFLETTFDEK